MAKGLKSIRGKRDRLMDDLISGQALLEKYDRLHVGEPGRARKLIEDAPSAEPEIIRCKDCKFYSPMNRETKTGICNLTTHQNFGDNWFCAGAERRTNGFD